MSRADPANPTADDVTARPSDRGAVIDVAYSRLVVEYDP